MQLWYEIQVVDYAGESFLGFKSMAGAYFDLSRNVGPYLCKMNGTAIPSMALVKI